VGCQGVFGVVGDIRGFVHGLYFSVVTMTTLGFGDIAANPDSWVGQVVLMVEVILGYVLLGALVTRLAVLFTSDGPVGSFTPMDEETKELLAKLKEDRK
jgi:voltage-gated potassium channel Kch